MLSRLLPRRSLLKWKPRLKTISKTIVINPIRNITYWKIIRSETIYSSAYLADDCKRKRSLSEWAKNGNLYVTLCQEMELACAPLKNGFYRLCPCNAKKACNCRAKPQFQLCWTEFHSSSCPAGCPPGHPPGLVVKKQEISLTCSETLDSLTK